MLDTDEVPLVDTLLVADVVAVDVAVLEGVLLPLVVPDDVAVADTEVVAELLTLLVAVLDKLVVALDNGHAGRTKTL